MYWLVGLGMSMVPVWWALTHFVAFVSVIDGLWKIFKRIASLIPGVSWPEPVMPTRQANVEGDPKHPPRRADDSPAAMQQRSFQKTLGYFRFILVIVSICVLTISIIWIIAFFHNWSVGSALAENEAKKWMEKNATRFNYCTEHGVYKPNAWKDTPPDEVETCDKVRKYVNTPTFSTAEFTWEYIINNQRWAGYWSFSGLVSGLSRFARIGWVTAGVMLIGVVVCFACGLVVYEFLTKRKVVHKNHDDPSLLRGRVDTSSIQWGTTTTTTRKRLVETPSEVSIEAKEKIK